MSRVHSIGISTITDVRVDDARITVRMTDDRELAIPTSWSPRLSGAQQDARDHWVIEAEGTEVEWPDVDEHLGLWTMLGVSEEEFMEAAGYEVYRSGS